MATSVIFCSEEHGAFYWIYFWHSIGTKYRRRQPCYLLSEPPPEDSFLPIQEAEHWGTMESPKLLLNGSVTCWHHVSSVATRHGAMATFSVTIWHMLFPPTLEKARKDASELHPSSCKVTIVYLCNVQGISEGRKTKKNSPCKDLHSHMWFVKMPCIGLSPQ